MGTQKRAEDIKSRMDNYKKKNGEKISTQCLKEDSNTSENIADRFLKKFFREDRWNNNVQIV